MKKKIPYFNLFISLIIINSCQKYNSFEKYIVKEYKQCNETNCIIDISDKLNFDWDTVCYLSGGYSLEEINNFLGFQLTQFTDIGNRLLFLKNNKVVCQYEWTIEADTHSGCVFFDENMNKRKISKSEAKFYVNKIGSEYYLKLYK
ncbi:MAG: hypothetical protein LBH32_10445 [Dysgonamonadaceae bacterium]|jgi:hypothetical protein|nr:hypothetical protein [Dysgonamonadaceae bacterium]